MRILALLSGLCATALGLAAHAEERIALIVGNGGYTQVSPLDNPASDAALMAQTLGDLGFEVNLLVDADLATMKTAIGAFGRSLRGAGTDATGLFYYAGHGVQSFGNNYLLPVDTVLQDAADLDLVALEAESLLRQMYTARNRTNIVILDACRNNPFADIPEFNDSGLAEMKAPTGTYLAYATAPGDVALDGAEGNSPFTTALAEEMIVPGVSIDQVFTNVRVRVLEQSGGQQTPWSTTSLTSSFEFREGVPVVSDVGRIWESVKANGDVLEIMLFLRQYGDSAYEAEARAVLAEFLAKELEPDSAQAAAPAPIEPDDSEKELIEKAQQSGAVEYFEAYLAQYPDGTFAELAQMEVEAHQARLAAQGAPEPDEPVDVADEPDTAPGNIAISGDVLFGSPLSEGAPEIVGRTMTEIVTLNPLFPPMEGIPEEMWKGQACTNCHDWNRDALCNQGNFYQDANAAKRSLTGTHPFGGSFKQNLRRWAASGCP